jgi:hypothetical protein
MFGAAVFSDSFVFTGGIKLYSVLLSDPAVPVVFGSSFWIQDPTSFRIQGRWLYSAEMSRFHVFDISMPESPTMAAEIRMPAWTDGMYVQDSLAFVGCGFTGLLPVNVARPEGPYIVDTIPVRGGVYEVITRDTIAYATATYDSGVRVINIKNLHAPFEVASLRMPSARGIAGTGVLLYVGYADGLMIVDISDPMHPVEAGRYDFSSGCGRVVIDSDLIYCLRGQAGFLILERIPTGSREANPSPPLSNQAVSSTIVGARAEFRINMPKGGEVKAQVLDIQGRMVLRKSLARPAGSSRIMLDLSRLPVGVYLVQLGTGQHVEVHRVVKITQLTGG